MSKGFKAMVMALLAFMLLGFSFSASKEVAKAEGAITYDFTGVAVPEGQPQSFEVDFGTLQLFKEHPEIIVAFTQALAYRYDNNVFVINQAAEAEYLKGAAEGTQPLGIHRANVFSVADLLAFQTAAGIQPTQPEAPQFTVTTADMSINGGTYVDINIDAQQLVLFQNGVASITTPIVTGNVAKGNNSPKGSFTIKNKQRNRTLIGPNYRSFVKYWVPFVNHVGIHDASWRSDFGGEIYKKSGSHGCINVPPANMPALYDALQVGMPVIVH
ncbi:MAG: L,D-transpeptidase [Lachnospiraceae bacterium]|nr:L,D-transpeptidase [Lachnospiraceae bacterium]